MKAKKSYAVITGASSGIGAEFAAALAKEGYSLILVARRKERLEQLKDTISKDINKALSILILEADLSSIDECKRLASFLWDKRISIFINNAGFGDCNYFLKGDVEKELSMIDVNIKALHFLTKRILQKLELQKGGYLLNVASSAGLIPAGPYMATYYATKAYVTSLTRAVAAELLEHNSPVYIGCLCPGPVNTEFNAVANVEFALKGISVRYCVDYAIQEMKKRTVVIVPTLRMKLATTFGRFLPQTLYIRLVAHQQKKKMPKE